MYNFTDYIFYYIQFSSIILYCLKLYCVLSLFAPIWDAARSRDLQLNLRQLLRPLRRCQLRLGEACAPAPLGRDVLMALDELRHGAAEPPKVSKVGLKDLS